jgi:hypothetical protein
MIRKQPRLDRTNGNTKAERRRPVGHEPRHDRSGARFGIKITKHEDPAAISRRDDQAEHAPVE